MNAFDLIGSAVSNSIRSKTRTLLTVLAIFIGAFTLTLTSGVGTGINRYIDDTVSSIGASDIITVTKTPAESTTDGPTEYNPDSNLVDGQNQGPATTSVEAITPADIDDLAEVSGVLSVEPTIGVATDYVQLGDGTQYQATVGSVIPGMTLQMVSGTQPDYNADDYEVALPESFVDPLGFSANSDAVGETITLGLTDATGARSTVDATVVGVTEPGLVGGSSLSANDSLTRALYSAQSVGLSEASRDSYASATVRFDDTMPPESLTELRNRLTDAGYDSTTVEDQIGSFKSVIDAIVLVLNGFAVIALIAAGFGIVNTLLMSVQERTREIGLMKAMGMGGGRVFGLFSLEAVFIGFLGSAIGVGAGMIAGSGINAALAGSLLADLPGLTLVAFDPLAVGAIVLTVMAIAFLAGTIPALRAAKADPIESLRYE
jgi:putative ABC transport system permease protein